MRLLRTDTYQLVEHVGDDTPPYAILSHVWDVEEVSFQDVQAGSAASRQGYPKLLGACAQAARDGFDYVVRVCHPKGGSHLFFAGTGSGVVISSQTAAVAVAVGFSPWTVAKNESHQWIDTCCIDKSSSAELSEAINSMFQWYANADVCYVYMLDVSGVGVPGVGSFEASRWFTRGWTLQELLAPPVVYFFTSDWRDIGSREELRHSIAGITKVPGDYFRTGDLTRYSAAQKMSWAARRRTTRIEDMAYCLLGMFGITMPLLYGEGSRAFGRLQEEILRRSEDDSLFVHRDFGHVLAPSPAAFEECHGIEKGDTGIYRAHQSLLLNRGLSITSKRVEMRFLVVGRQRTSHRRWLSLLLAMGHGASIYVAVLNCSVEGLTPVILLHKVSPGVFVRAEMLSDKIGYLLVRDETLRGAEPRTVILPLGEADTPNPWRRRSRSSIPRFDWDTKPPVTNTVGQQTAIDRHGRGNPEPLQPGKDGKSSLRDNLVIKFSSRSAFGFALGDLHTGSFYRRLNRGDEVHFILQAGGDPGRPWFLFCNDRGRSFLVVTEPSRASINTRLITNVFKNEVFYGDKQYQYEHLLRSEEALEEKDKKATIISWQEVDDFTGVEVHLSSRKRADGWWLTIRFENPYSYRSPPLSVQ